MNNTETLKRILDMYKFCEPLPDAVKLRMLTSRKKNLIVILKRFGKYSILTMFAIYLFFAIKKAGISLSIVKSYIVVSVVSVAAAGSVAAVSVITVKKQLAKESAPVSQMQVLPEASAAASPESPSAAPKISYAVEIQPFTAPADLKSEQYRLREALGKKLKAGGRESMLLSYAGQSVNAPYRITGSIIALGDTRTVNVRLIDSTTSRVLSSVSETIEKGENIQAVADKLAAELGKFIK